MTAIAQGRVAWDVTRDDEGHREYRLVTAVRTDSRTDGPARVLSAPGLPLIGTPWIFGNDLDFWAFCHPNATVRPAPGVEERDGFLHWFVEQKFSTRPIIRCQDITIEDPVLEPPKVSGSFTRYSEPIPKIENSAGDLVSVGERDADRPTVIIEMNTYNIELDIWSDIVNTINDAPLWGLDAGTVKLSNVSWERKYRGICEVYYTRRFEFEVRHDGFEVTIADSGFRVKEGDWDKDLNVWVPTGNNNLIHMKDINDIPVTEPINLDGDGNPLPEGDPVEYLEPVQPYESRNFFVLGIPAYL